MAFPFAAVLAVASLVGSALQTYRNIKKAKRARREASELDLREATDSSGRNVPLVYGITIVEGLECYAQIGNGITSGVSSALDASGNKFGSLERSSDDDDNEYLLQQWVLAAGGARRILTALVHGTPITRSQNEDGYAGAIVGEGRPAGGVSPFAQGLADSDLFPQEITASSLYTNLAYASTLAWNKRGGLHGRFLWGGKPTLEYIIEGRPVKQPDPTATSGAFNQTVAAEQPVSNLASVLYDLIADAPTGPQVAATRLDLAGTWLESWKQAAPVVQGANAEASTDTSVIPYAGSGAYATLIGNWRTANSLGAGTSGLNAKSYDSLAPQRNLLLKEFNGSIPTDAPWAEQITDIVLSAHPATFVFLSREGTYKLRIPDPKTPAADQNNFVLTAADIRADSLKVYHPNAQTKLNQVAVEITDRDLDFSKNVVIWPQDDSTQHTAWVADDGELLATSLQPRGVPTIGHAQTLARTVCLLSRRPTFEVTVVGDRAFDLEPGHKITLETPRKTIDTPHMIESVKGDGESAVIVLAREFHPDDFAWTYESVDGDDSPGTPPATRVAVEGRTIEIDSESITVAIDEVVGAVDYRWQYALGGVLAWRSHLATTLPRTTIGSLPSNTRVDVRVMPRAAEAEPPATGERTARGTGFHNPPADTQIQMLMYPGGSDVADPNRPSDSTALIESFSTLSDYQITQKHFLTYNDDGALSRPSVVEHASNVRFGFNRKPSIRDRDVGRGIWSTRKAGEDSWVWDNPNLVDDEGTVIASLSVADAPSVRFAADSVDVLYDSYADLVAPSSVGSDVLQLATGKKFSDSQMLYIIAQQPSGTAFSFWVPSAWFANLAGGAITPMHSFGALIKRESDTSFSYNSAFQLDRQQPIGAIYGYDFEEVDEIYSNTRGARADSLNLTSGKKFSDYDFLYVGTQVIANLDSGRGVWIDLEHAATAYSNGKYPTIYVFGVQDADARFFIVDDTTFAMQNYYCYKLYGIKVSAGVIRDRTDEEDMSMDDTSMMTPAPQSPLLNTWIYLDPVYTSVGEGVVTAPPENVVLVIAADGTPTVTFDKPMGVDTSDIQQYRVVVRDAAHRWAQELVIRENLMDSMTAVLGQVTTADTYTATVRAEDHDDNGNFVAGDWAESPAVTSMGAVAVNDKRITLYPVSTRPTSLRFGARPPKATPSSYQISIEVLNAAGDPAPVTVAAAAQGLLHTFTGLTANTTYYVEAWAVYDSGGNGPVDEIILQTPTA